jgi:type VI secretion system protein ImpF
VTLALGFPMSRIRGEGPVTLSLIDRLIDEDPKRSEEVPLTRSQSLRALKAAVRRDLEWLLNTRQPLDMPSQEQLQNSLLVYGLPDISSMALSSLKDRQRLTQSIEDAIQLFEPRLANVRVTLASAGGDKLPQLRFVIEGMLRVDPSPEPVSFDTLLELSSREYKVQGEPGAR